MNQQPLWRPSEKQIADANMTGFMQRASRYTGQGTGYLRRSVETGRSTISKVSGR